MYCLIEKPVSKVLTGWIDDWALRIRAALTLCHIDRYVYDLEVIALMSIPDY